jgi:hypothetical protein
MLFFFLLISSFLVESSAIAQPTSDIRPAIQVPGIKGELNLNEMGVCMSGLTNAQCQNDTNCIHAYFQKNNSCQQVNSIFQFTNSWPIAARQYTNVSVIKLANQQFLIIDSTGKFITASAHLSLEQAPGFLQLKTAYPSAQLTDQLQDFPIAVYLSETNNQLLFLQSIIAPPCQSTCQPVAIAKVLYGFSIDGHYSGANVLRIVQEKS